MSKTLIAAAASLLMLPVAAHAEEAAPIRFVDHGVDYSYTSETKGDTRILKGSAYGGLEPFELHVNASRVTGTFDGKDVEFSRREFDHLAMAKIASR